MVQIENSTDLESGRRPELKSVEFSICTEGGDEIMLDFGRDRAEIMGTLIGILSRWTPILPLCDVHAAINPAL